MRRLSPRDMLAICLLCAAALIAQTVFAGANIIVSLVIFILFCGAVSLYGQRSKADISEPEAARDPSLKEQAKLAERFAEPILIINHHQKIIYANPAAKALFPERNIGTTLPNLAQNRDVRKLAEDTLAGRNHPPVKLQIDKPVERHFRVTGSSMTSAAGTDTKRRALIVFYDITSLMRANAMRADFLANASHELKTPIASLLGYIETLRGHAKDDPEARETFLVIMQQQAERMQRLIADLLSLRRIELAEHMPPKETADLYLAARAAIESVEPLATSRNVRIDFQGSRKVLVTGIQDELVQLVLNLLDNALKFSPPDASISLNLDILEDWHPGQIFTEDPEFGTAHKRRIVLPSHTGSSFAALRIRDAGPGFDREHLPRLGERFYKITDQDVSVKRGTGLGLAIVKHIILRHRGGLFVESAKGAGTKFTILLPIATKG